MGLEMLWERTSQTEVLGAQMGFECTGREEDGEAVSQLNNHTFFKKEL